jgi:elongation factor 1-beta
MSKVAIVYSIMPSSPQADLNAIKQSIINNMPSYAEIKGFAIKPVAFGLNAIHVMVVTDDKIGSENIEKILSKIDDVQNVSVVEYNLL